MITYFFFFLLSNTELPKYDIYIANKDFICSAAEETFAFCIKDGFKFPCKDFSASVPYEIQGEGILKIFVRTPTDYIDFSFKEDENSIQKSIPINFYCFEELNLEPKIIERNKNLRIEISTKIHPENVSGKVLYGKIANLNLSSNSIIIDYEKQFNYPYKDLLILYLSKSGKIYVSFVEIIVPSYLSIESQTEPLSKIKIITKYSEYSARADSKGNFRIRFKVFPDEKEIKIKVEDRAGNISWDKLELNFPEREVKYLEALSFEDKALFLTYNIKYNTIQNKPDLKKISNHIIAFAPNKPGEHSVEIDDRKFKFVRKSIPAFLTISYSPAQNQIYADGTSKIIFSAKISDTFGEELQLPVELTHNYDKNKIEIKKEEGKNEFTISVKKKIKDELKIVFKHGFLKEEIDFWLLPGVPSEIYVELDRDYIVADGEDQLKILAYVQDAGGNVVPIDDLEISSNIGKINKSKKTDGTFEITYSATSKQELSGEIAFRFENISKRVPVRIIPRRLFFEGSAGIGIINNLGKVFAPAIFINFSMANLLFGKYIFLDLQAGYLYAKVETVSFNSLFISGGSSYELWSARVGIGGSLFLHSASSEHHSGKITENFYQVAPYIRLGYILGSKKHKIFPHISVLFPISKKEEGLIQVENSFENIMLLTSYILEF